MVSLSSSLFVRLLRVWIICFLSGSFAVTGFGAKPKLVWTPATQEELAETSAQIEPGAAAEALLNKVEIDEGYDGGIRSYHTTQRYKIYDPARASSVLSLDYWEAAAKDTSLVVEARLTIPSGQVMEFDKKSFMERTVENKSERSGLLKLLGSANEKSTQRYLPIAGVERGAVLEIQMTWEKTGDGIPPVDLWLMQLSDVPVRKSEFISLCKSVGVAGRISTLNGAPLDVSTVNKRRVVKASAVNLPAMHAEPFSGALNDNCALAVMIVQGLDRMPYQRPDPDELKKKALAGHKIQSFGGWVTWANALGSYADQYGSPTARVKKLIPAICAGAGSDEEKSRRIHNHVLQLYEKYRQHTQQKKLRSARMGPSRINDVLDAENLNRALTAEDFLLLTYALNKAAGLDAYIVALPDRSYLRFNQRLVSVELLSGLAVGVLIDGRWSFSVPCLGLPLPFDMLPPPNLAQVGLVGQNGEEFISVPMPAPESTEMSQAGNFRLHPDGRLQGGGRLSFTGYYAVMLRYVLRDLDGPTQKRMLREAFLSELPPSALLEIGDIGGLNGIEEPLVVDFSLTWEGYATRVDDRLIVKPSVFRFASRSPFTASTRKTPVVYEFKWRERDQVVIDLPEEFSLEDPSAPVQYPGRNFDYKVALKYHRKQHQLILERQFTNDCVEVVIQAYPVIKEIHERIQRSDEYEIALKLKPDTRLVPAQPVSDSAH